MKLNYKKLITGTVLMTSIAASVFGSNEEKLGMSNGSSASSILELAPIIGDGVKVESYKTNPYSILDTAFDYDKLQIRETTGSGVMDNEYLCFSKNDNSNSIEVGNNVESSFGPISLMNKIEASNSSISSNQNYFYSIEKLFSNKKYVINGSPYTLAEALNKDAKEIYSDCDPVDFAKIFGGYYISSLSTGIFANIKVIAEFNSLTAKTKAAVTTGIKMKNKFGIENNFATEMSKSNTSGMIRLEKRCFGGNKLPSVDERYFNNIDFDNWENTFQDYLCVAKKYAEDYVKLNEDAEGAAAQVYLTTYDEILNTAYDENDPNSIQIRNQLNEILVVYNYYNLVLENIKPIFGNDNTYSNILAQCRQDFDNEYRTYRNSVDKYFERLRTPEIKTTELDELYNIVSYNYLNLVRVNQINMNILERYDIIEIQSRYRTKGNVLRPSYAVYDSITETLYWYDSWKDIFYSCGGFFYNRDMELVSYYTTGVPTSSQLGDLMRNGDMKDQDGFERTEGVVGFVVGNNNNGERSAEVYTTDRKTGKNLMYGEIHLNNLGRISMCEVYSLQGRAL